MNGYDALKTGRRVKQVCDPHWYTLRHCVLVDSGDGKTCNADHDALCCDDWQVEPVIATITSDTFWAAYRDALKEVHQKKGLTMTLRAEDGVVASDVLPLMAQKLGLVP